MNGTEHLIYQIIDRKIATCPFPQLALMSLIEVIQHTFEYPVNRGSCPDKWIWTPSL